MKAGYSLWIKGKDGQRVFGQGPWSLLLLVNRLGSLNKAAKEMSMSYSKASRIINNAEKNLGVKLLNREIGGSQGGGSNLTDEAMVLIRKYEKFREASSQEIERIYNEIFQGESEKIDEVIR